MKSKKKSGTVISIDLNKLEKNYHAFSKFGKVYFPTKTNHNSIILNHLKTLGCSFECDCREHMSKVISKDKQTEIIYSNVAKKTSDIKWAISNGVTFFTIDDSDTLERIISTAIKSNVECLKINVRLNVYDIFRSEFIKKGVEDSRLGSSDSTCRMLFAQMRQEKRIKILYGLSFYVQAEIHDKEDMLLVVGEYIARHFDKKDGIAWINIGGGSKVKTLEVNLPKFRHIVRKLNAKDIILEPGRYMVDGVEDAYVPCTRAMNKDNGELVVSINMGIYHGLIDKRLHNRTFDIYISNETGEEKLVPTKKYLYKERSDIECNRLVLRGATADSIDIIGTYLMPKTRIEEGTVFRMANVGAYVEVLNSAFSGKMNITFDIKK